MTARLRWLPGVDDEADRPRGRADDEAHRRMHTDEAFDPSGQESRPPLPTAFAVGGCAAYLRGAGEGLGRLEVRHRVAAVSRVGRSWMDPLDRHRREALERLPDELGTSEEVVAWGLDATFSSWTSEALRRWSEGATHSAHARLTGHVWAGNVFTAGLPPVAASLLCGVPALIKAPGRLPTFAALFARSVSDHAPELGPSVGAAAWPRDDVRATRALLAADEVFAFGDGSSLDALDRLAPRPVHRFGPRYSVAVSGGRPRSDALTRLTEDLLAYDGEGCLTPRWLFVEGGLDAAVDVARRAAPLLAEAARTVLPGRPLAAGPGAARAAFLGQAAFGGWSDAGPGWYAAATPWDPSLATPSRGLHVVPVARLADVPSLLSPLGPRLQGCAHVDMDALAPDLLDGLRALGLSRAAPAGELQRPPVDWIHDDVDPLSILARS